MKRSIVILALVLLSRPAIYASPLDLGQWTNRYPKVEGYRSHVYLEGFELPILAAGPTDPAPSPDDESIAFAARGWLWLLDLSTGKARRLTSGKALDSRPTWSADGTTIAFLRDDTLDIDIWTLDLSSGEESPIVDTEAIELDPAYSPDGEFLYYSSARAGDLDLWRLRLATAESIRITEARGLELRPLPLADGQRLVYVAKGGGLPDRIVELDLEQGSQRTLRAQSITSQTHPTVSPSAATLAINWPGNDGYDLFLLDLANEDWIRLTRRPSLPLSPAFSADGSSVYFVEANNDLQFELFRISASGGRVEPVPVRAWDWGERTVRLRIETRKRGTPGPLPTRLAIVDGSGHPVVVNNAMPRFDSTHGRVFIYTPGVLEVEVPAGRISVTATHGFATRPVSREVAVAVGEGASVELVLEPLWDPRAAGWYAGDHHYHMNYGGAYRLHPSDLLLPLQAEDMDIGTPLMANLHQRFNDLKFFEWRRLGERPSLLFGQEVRSHFLGHLGLVNIHTPHWPWYWGPGYPVYGRDDRPNHEVLRFARRQGGVTSYMHPIRTPEPFVDDTTLASIPINLVADAVMGDLDALELACLWTSELGTSEFWERILNIGVPLAASAGTDSFADYYRSMAVGSTRIYVKLDTDFNLASYLEGLRAGKSFVTTGPLIDFSVEGVSPGGVFARPESGTAAWSLTLASVQPVERIEIIVNGETVTELPGLAESGHKDLQGRLELPAGGWVGVRVHGGEERWPGMNGYPFAQSSPIWIRERGSTDTNARRRAARELLRALDVAERRLHEGYGDAPIPQLQARFDETRSRLEELEART